MRTLLFAGCALACVALSGCQTQGAAVLNDLQGCHRHYNGAVTSGLAGLTAPQFTGSVDIECAAGITTGVLIPNATAAPAKTAMTPAEISAAVAQAIATTPPPPVPK